MLPGCISALGAAENPSCLQPQRPRTFPAFLLGCRFSSDIVGNCRKIILDIIGGLCLGSPSANQPGLFPGCFPLSFQCLFPVSFTLPSVPGLLPWLLGFHTFAGAVPPTSSRPAYRSTDNTSNPGLTPNRAGVQSPIVPYL